MGVGRGCRQLRAGASTRQPCRSCHRCSSTQCDHAWPAALGRGCCAAAAARPRSQHQLLAQVGQHDVPRPARLGVGRVQQAAQAVHRGVAQRHNGQAIHLPA